jgi:hypothetical protein
MSYCRWSSDNFNCDIYAYESDMGYEVHVAAGKYKGKIPETDFSLIRQGGDKNIAKYMRQRKAQSKYLEKCGTEPIGLPFDGESYTLVSLQEFYDKMLELKNTGYMFPDYVLEVIKEELCVASQEQ